MSEPRAFTIYGHKSRTTAGGFLGPGKTSFNPRGEPLRPISRQNLKVYSVLPLTSRNSAKLTPRSESASRA
ncbi:hypothetical protein TWF225_004419 [Orbilia oligospora]|nr:hypothetical protein TWF751_007302 [Orbilia oligospora]KAF3187269.1 hypothetical protein TWF225_004419 [Orbilia oligospora]KAF3267152.1 hypothetical protein TWF128_010099 [Orbilia oligospora]